MRLDRLNMCVSLFLYVLAFLLGLFHRIQLVCVWHVIICSYSRAGLVRTVELSSKYCRPKKKRRKERNFRFRSTTVTSVYVLLAFSLEAADLHVWIGGLRFASVHFPVLRADFVKRSRTGVLIREPRNQLGSELSENWIMG